jgi:D-glycero-alpha-D-manno-heptose-7-phosphate kinase
MIITKTPFRISFFGGGTDIPEWFTENGGSVLSTTIDKYLYISARYLPNFFDHKYRFVYSEIENVKHINDVKHNSLRNILNFMKWEKGIELHHDGDLPARSGLGSSSSFAVGVLNTLYALRGMQVSKEKLADEAIHIERNLLKENVGLQDQVAASFGGFNRIDFSGNSNFQVSPLIITESRKNELQSNLLLFFTGISRFASDIENSKINNFSNRKAELNKLQQMVPEGIDILVNKDRSILDFGYLLNEGWELKKSLSDKVSSNEINNYYSKALVAGALGGKILGAGGGGFLLLFAPLNAHEKIINTLKNLIHVPFKFENGGSSVVIYQPNGF